MGPPAGGSLKHKPTGCRDASQGKTDRSLTTQVPEPATKRKTLQDIAGEQRNNKPAPSSSRPVSAAAKNATNGPRGHSASTTRLPSTSAPKPSSTSSFGGSVGYGGRAPSANGYTRPKTSQSQYNHGRSKSQYHASRPASRAEAEVERPERKGAFPLSISTNPGSRHESLHLPKQRHVKDRAVSFPAARSVSGASRRTSQSSISTLVPTSPALEDPVDADFGELVNGLGALSMGASVTGTRGQGGRGIFSGKGYGASLNSSTSHPRVTRHQLSIQSLFKTPTKSRRDPSSPSKATPVFLNRFTNDHAPVFDTELRLDGFERQFIEFKEKIEKETSQANDLKETIKILQTRGTLALMSLACSIS
jgi:kinesin family protein C1